MTEQPKTALITGGGSGIGFAVSRSLAERGWNVALCGRDRAKLERAAASIAGGDPDRVRRLFVREADVSKTGDVQQWVGEALERFGGPDLLVNNAGVGASGTVASLTDEQWDRALRINLTGAFLCTREVLPHMRSRGGGWIINIASLAGKKGMPGSSAYSASKFGLVGLTESLAREEVKHGIRTTAICPAYVATPMVAGAAVPVSEMIRPEDIAATVLYLLNLGANAVVREIVIERVGVL